MEDDQIVFYRAPARQPGLENDSVASRCQQPDYNPAGRAHFLAGGIFHRQNAYSR
jgi:hypothetical protein